MFRLLLARNARRSAAGVALVALSALGAVFAAPKTAMAAEAPTAGAAACEAMARFSAPGLTVLSAQWVMGGSIENRQHDRIALPAHCIVKGALDRRIGQDGKPYAIGFELRLPENWTDARFLFQGGGGTDGVVSPAYGVTPLSGSHAVPALARGFAVVSTDAGHSGLSADFGRDLQARKDYGYVALERVTATAKLMIQAFYQHPIRHSYFMGCSNGGRQAFMATQRLPDAFDGVVAGAPGFALTQAAVAELWDTRTLLSVAPKDDQGRPILSRALTPVDLNLLAAAILKSCDGLDGLVDGMVNDVKACRFDPKVVACPPGQSSECLAPDKIAAIRKIFGGAHDSQGRLLFAPWPYDPGVAAANWRTWKLGVSPTSVSDAQNVTLGGQSLAEVFLTPARSPADLDAFDFDSAAAQTQPSADIINAVSTDLSPFRAHGGKLLIYQGAADPVFSADRLFQWFDAVSAQGDPSPYARLFVVPGMNHCGMGPATDDFDPLSAMVDWVEHDHAPDRLIARGASFPGLTRPLCPYPSVARYQGGDIKDEKSFVCS
jgi:feruloyl esterase